MSSFTSKTYRSNPESRTLIDSICDSVAMCNRDADSDPDQVQHHHSSQTFEFEYNNEKVISFASFLDISDTDQTIDYRNVNSRKY